MSTTRPAITRAPFRYWGSKARMAPWVIDRLPAHTHYVEGCAGSAAVLAAKPPVAIETVNDTYGEVVNFFRVLRDPDQAARLIELVALTPYSLEEFLAAADRLAQAVPDADPVARAHAFAVRMGQAVIPGRTGWSYVVAGTASKSAIRWASYPESLAASAIRFRRVQVESRPLVDLIGRYDKPGVLIFVDPPYDEESRPTSTGASSAYAEDAFDHDEFLEAALAARHASFAIAHYPTPRYDAAGLTVAGDYSSHRNRPNGETDRDVKAERLYVIDRNPRTDQPEGLFA